MLNKPPYTINDKILKAVSSICEKLGRLKEHSSVSNKPYLRRNNKIRSIHSSLRIEANSLSLDDVQDIISGQKVFGPLKEIQEVKNAYDAYELIPEINPYDISDLLSMHEVMTRYTVDFSGNFRKGEEGVFDGDRCIFMAPPASLVPELMDNLFAWMSEYKDEVHPLILSAVFHYEFVFIHPFVDGNGRMARLWHNAILYKWNPVFEFIPLETQIEKFQNDYYNAIAKCHSDGESTHFIEFILKQLDDCINEINILQNPKQVSLTVQLKKLLEVMDYNMPYTANELLGILGLKSKESLRANYLNPAINMRLIKMSVPDKPKSKNQMYIKINPDI